MSRALPERSPDRADERFAAGWAFRVRTSDLDALGVLQHDCREAGVRLEVGRLDQSADDLDSDPCGLTPKQRAILTTAIEDGYFAIPRGTTSSIAAKLDVSDRAVSECLRRAQRNLLHATVLTDE